MPQAAGSIEQELALQSPLCMGRGRRVIVLVLGILILSLADLAVTLAFLRANWMMEANPIAAFLIEETRSPLVLIAFKAVTVGICVGLLYRVRHYRCGEVAAWCAMVILTVMSLMWHSYSSHFEGPEDITLAQFTSVDDSALGLP